MIPLFDINAEKSLLVVSNSTKMSAQFDMNSEKV